MSDLMQRARDIAAAHVNADHFRSEFHDAENTASYLSFMREGAYDQEPVVQAALAALREGMTLAGSAAT